MRQYTMPQLSASYARFVSWFRRHRVHHEVSSLLSPGISIFSPPSASMGCYRCPCVPCALPNSMVLTCLKMSLYQPLANMTARSGCEEADLAHWVHWPGSVSRGFVYFVTHSSEINRQDLEIISPWTSRDHGVQQRRRHTGTLEGKIMEEKEDGRNLVVTPAGWRWTDDVDLRGEHTLLWDFCKWFYLNEPNM